MTKAKDPFKELREAPYPLYVAPRPYSYDLAQDMIDTIRGEFDTEKVASKFAEAVSGKETSEVEKIGKEYFEDYGQKWMKRVMQLGEEYSDRTIELVREAVDPEGNQFLIWPHVPQRYLEIAYLSTQEYPKFLKLPFRLNNQWEISYRIPGCYLFRLIKEKCGDEVANLMTCKNGCLTALDTIAKDMELNTVIDITATNAKDGYCQFSMRKL